MSERAVARAGETKHSSAAGNAGEKLESSALGAFTAEPCRRRMAATSSSAACLSCWCFSVGPLRANGTAQNPGSDSSSDLSVKESSVSVDSGSESTAAATSTNGFEQGRIFAGGMAQLMRLRIE